MVARISGSIGAGALITAALIYWMQLMIEDGDDGWTGPNRYVPVRLVRIIEPPKPIDRTEPPPRPAPQIFPPDTDFAFTDSTTVPDLPDDPVTPPGPPSPLAGPGGRSGPWISDRNLMPLTQIAPTYPAAALRRELEGHVIVEFTVTKRGDVSNARVIQSTDRTFDRQALSAVERSKYRPRIVDGAPVNVTGVTTRVEFRLED
jgi:protein TonB